MLDWNDPAVLNQSAAAFANIILVVLGVYVWEFFNTLWFELSFISPPRRNWRIQHVSYFACRYSFLGGITILVGLFNLKEGTSCPALAQTAQILGNIALGTATLNILYRAWAISLRYGRLLTTSLAIAEVAHWAILIWNIVTVHAEWVPTANACSVTHSSRTALVTLYVYTMLFDLAILLICIIGMWKYKSKAGGQIWQLLRRQGIYYFLISFAANLLPCLFILLNLNSVMDSIATVPAACAITIASCRAVIWLTSWIETDGSGLSDHPEIQMTPSAPPGRRKASTKAVKTRDLENGGMTTDMGVPSEIFARTRRNDEAERDLRSASDDPSDFKSPHSPSHYSPTSAPHPVILPLSDKVENQAGASGSTASSVNRPDTSPLLLATKGYYPYDDRGRRATSPDSRPSTGDDDRPVRGRYDVS